jgi:hypothetical protein
MIVGGGIHPRHNADIDFARQERRVTVLIPGYRDMSAKLRVTS